MVDKFRQRVLLKRFRDKLLQLSKSLVPEQQSSFSSSSMLKLVELNIEKIEEAREVEMNKLRNVDSYRKEFLSNVSHELRTPIFNIEGYIHTLLDGALEDKNISTTYLRKAAENLERITALIDDLDAISQLEPGKIALEIREFDIVKLIYDVVEDLRRKAILNNCYLIISTHIDSCIVVADRERIRQVLINLVNNSITYGKQGGTTTLTLSIDDLYCFVEVKDDGIGISDEHLPRIFERFYRVDKDRSRLKGGSGLGLSIVKHIIEAHQSVIQVESKINLGTRFVFRLDRKSQDH